RHRDDLGRARLDARGQRRGQRRDQGARREEVQDVSRVREGHRLMAGEKLTVLVTGGSGFLGSHISEQLAREGHTVRALVRKSSNKKFLESLAGVELAYGAVEDLDAVKDAAKGVDAIIHSAGLVKARGPEEFYRTSGT